MCRIRPAGYFFLFILLVLMMMVSVDFARAVEQPDFDLNSSSAILLEYTSGDILYEKNPHEELPPASMAKIMTMLLVVEAVEDGRADLDDKIVISEHAAEMGGSQIWLEPGEEMTLRELMKAIAIVSANDACVAVAEYLYGTEDAFVDRMNERARELGLEHTYFYNTNGLPSGESDVEGTYTCAHDLAVMARELISYSRVLEWTSTWTDYLRDGDSVLNNTNRLIRHYQGADGLKTGYTDEAKFGLTGTAERNGMRFISVVMGAESSMLRFEESVQLLSYGFNSFRPLDIASKGEVVWQADVWNARERSVELRAAKSLKIPQKKGEKEEIVRRVYVDEDLSAPLRKGEKAGKVEVLRGDKVLAEVDIVVSRDVEKVPLFILVFRLIERLLFSLKNIFS